jgi:hypothetical protein
MSSLTSSVWLLLLEGGPIFSSIALAKEEAPLRIFRTTND